MHKPRRLGTGILSAVLAVSGTLPGASNAFGFQAVEERTAPALVATREIAAEQSPGKVYKEGDWMKYAGALTERLCTASGQSVPAGYKKRLAIDGVDDVAAKVLARDKSVSGVVGVLMDAGVGEAVGSARDIRVGDVVQYWRKLSNGTWTGLPGVVLRTEHDGEHARLTLCGAFKTLQARFDGAPSADLAAGGIGVGPTIDAMDARYVVFCMRPAFVAQVWKALTPTPKQLIVVLVGGFAASLKSLSPAGVWSYAQPLCPEFEVDQQLGVCCLVEEEDWRCVGGVAEQLIQRINADKEGRVVLVGHSLGATACLQIAELLGERGVGVDLVVAIDARKVDLLQAWRGGDHYPVQRIVHILAEGTTVDATAWASRGVPDAQTVRVSGTDHTSVDDSELTAAIVLELVQRLPAKGINAFGGVVNPVRSVYWPTGIDDGNPDLGGFPLPDGVMRVKN